MSDRKRDKNSKSTYMRQARKQRMIENQFMMEIEKAQQLQEQLQDEPRWKKKRNKRNQWDDEE